MGSGVSVACSLSIILVPVCALSHVSVSFSSVGVTKFSSGFSSTSQILGGLVGGSGGCGRGGDVRGVPPGGGAGGGLVLGLLPAGGGVFGG